MCCAHVPLLVPAFKIIAQYKLNSISPGTEMLVSHVSIILLFETGPHYVLEHYVDPAVCAFWDQSHLPLHLALRIEFIVIHVHVCIGL